MTKCGLNGCTQEFSKMYMWIRHARLEHNHDVSFNEYSEHLKN
jgi:hypothetical protein